jgi:hypothetical protein
MKKSLLLSISAGTLCLLNGCGTSAPPPPPPVATHFSVTAPAAVTAGTAFNVTVSALDASNSVVTGYSGTVSLASSDSQAVLPAASGLTNGMKTFSVTFKTAIGQTIIATDAASLTGTSNAINVSAGPATRLNVSAANAATVGIPFNVTVTAFDAYNNTATGYSGMVHFSSSDPQAVLPANSALANGMGIFPVTLKTMANATITATDTVTASLTGSSTPISVFSNAPTHLLVATLGNATTRAPISVQVKALDGANNISAGYSGTVHFTSTDSKAILPADATLPNGIGNFSATLETAGNQMITVTDKVTASLVGTSNSISVSAATTLMITSGAPPSGIVGVSYGSNNFEVFRCIWTGGMTRPVLSCSPCSGSSGCSSLPPCTSNPFISPCHQTRVGFAFRATGGIPPYRWSTPQNSMPPGLSVNSQNGEILGTPSLANSYPIVVTLADSGTPQATTPGSYTIVINNPPRPVINATPAPPAGAVNLPYSFTFTASSTAPPLTWRVSAGTPPGGLTLSPTGVLSGTPTATGSSTFSLIAEDSFKQDSAPQSFTIQIFAHGFKATGSMAAPRTSHTATLLNTGKVLVAGGTDGSGNPIATAELYDPTTGSFSPTGSMATARAHFAATLLPSGKVLVTGGLDTAGNPLATAELYDPSAGTFSPTTGNMQFVHASHTATLLSTGKVLVAGWGNATAELFDPATGTFAQTGSMATARVSHTATLLNNGKVLLTGGIQGAPPATTVLAEAELYDPASGSFLPTLGRLVTAREWHTASLLAGGKVLVTGGLDSTGNAIATAELFDPTNQSFTATTGNMGTARAFQTATVLKDGTVLVAGGDPPGAVVLATAELYNPTSQTFTPTGSMGTARSAHTATLLTDGRVLVTGGTNGSALATAELYQ